MEAKILTTDISTVLLPQDQDLRRLPRAPNRKRPQKFWDNFEDRVLVYDVFWHMDGEQVLLVCPPALNLEVFWHSTSFIALPSGNKVSSKIHNIRSSMTVALTAMPKDSTHIEMTFDGIKYTAEIMPNLADQFDGNSVIFTMSQNNPLHWIEEWASYHQVMHKADAVIIFDNGSTIYNCQDVAKSLAKIPGIEKVLVMSVPHKYGPHDPGVFMHRFWANFLQVSTFSILLRRLAGKAFGLLNVDIDELAAPLSASNVFEAAHESQDGLYRMLGNWVESVPEENATQNQPTHLAYRTVRRDIRHRLNAKKWALDPTRKWLEDLDVHPSVHRVMNMPKEMAKRVPKGLFWHFKGINTNWKHDRLVAAKRSGFFHRRPPKLSKMLDEFEKNKEARDG